MTTEDLKNWAKIAAEVPQEIKDKFVDADKSFHKFMVSKGVPNHAAMLLVAGWHERRCGQLMDALEGFAEMSERPTEAAKYEEE